MRATVLAWSTFGGALLGLFAGIGLVVLTVLAAAVLPPPISRGLARVRLPGLIVFLIGLPALGALLGYLEGKLKV